MTELAKSYQDTGIESVDANANPEWKEDAFRALVKVAQSKKLLTVVDVWNELGKEDKIYGTHELSAMGPIMLRGAREKIIENTGKYKNSKRTSLVDIPMSQHRGKYGQPQRVWGSLLLDYKSPYKLLDKALSLAQSRSGPICFIIDNIKVIIQRV